MLYNWTFAFILLLQATQQDGNKNETVYSTSSLNIQTVPPAGKTLVLQSLLLIHLKFTAVLKKANQVMCPFFYTHSNVPIYLLFNVFIVYRVYLTNTISNMLANR